MVTQESIEDCLVPFATEYLASEWMCRQSEITAELGAKSEAYESQLQQGAESYLKREEQNLRQQADDKLNAIKKELDKKLADEIVQLKNKVKTSLQSAREEEESQTLNLVARTLKATKPSPLNICKPKKMKKRKTNVLDDEAAVGVVCRLEHSQKEIVLQSVHGPVFILQSTIGHVVQ